MSSVYLILPVVLPILGGALMPLLHLPERQRNLFLELLVLLTSILAVLCVIQRPADGFTMFHLTGNMDFALRLDGLGSVFTCLLAVLWPLATLYAFEYMRHEERTTSFFAFYTMTYGVTLGIAMAKNLVTMYLFYELLTLVSVYLVMHPMTRKALHASRTYLYYSIGGAAFAFISLIFVILFGETTDFILGGVLDPRVVGDNLQTVLVIYLLAFVGFGVKAAVFPFQGWLPKASVAPTPVTALLHAVAVVKSGAFAIIRLTYYSFGIEFVRGTWAQNVLMAIVLFTIIYGCSRALKETHLKRRLAYSTISNLSYILFGVVMMTPAGLVGALSHLVFHAVMKICSFFCAGAVMHQTDRVYVHELNGMGRKMPCVFGIFTVSSLGLMGVPGLAGFISKWNLAAAAVESGNRMAVVGIGCLLVSALLTAMYMLTIVIRGFFPENDFDMDTIKDVKDPDWKMLLPLFVFSFFIIAFGLDSSRIVEFFGNVAAGVY